MNEIKVMLSGNCRSSWISQKKDVILQIAESVFTIHKTLFGSTYL